MQDDASNKKTRHLSFLEKVVSSPALTISYREKEDKEDIFVNILTPEHISLDETPISNVHDSLFTPPISPLSSSSEPWKTPRTDSPFLRKAKVIMSHVLVPPLSRPKSQYINLSVVAASKKRPRTASTLESVLEGAWRNNQRLDWLVDEDSDDIARRKKRKRKPKHTPEVEKEPGSAKDIVIDLTADDDEGNHLSLRAGTSPKIVTQVLDEVAPANRQTSTEEIPIRIGTVNIVSQNTLLYNTRFLRHSSGDVTPQLVEKLNCLPLPRRRALLDNLVPSSLDNELSLGSRIVYGEKYDYEDSDNDSITDIVDLLDPYSNTPVSDSPRPVPTISPTPVKVLPKIDLAAKFRKKRNTSQRTPSTLTSSAHLQPAVTRSPSSFLSVENVLVNSSGRSPRTPLLPSAKALGKRKALDSPLQLFHPRPDTESLFPPSGPLIPSPKNLPTYPDNFDEYISIPSSPFRSIPTNYPSYFDPNLVNGTYPTLSSINSIDHRNPHNPSYPNVEQAALVLPYGYIPEANGFDQYPNDPSPTFFSTWSSELEDNHSYNDGTVNPSMLGGEPHTYVGTDFCDEEKYEDISTFSPPPQLTPHKIKLKPPSRALKESGPGRKLSPVNDSPRRRRTNRSRPDMVPTNMLELSSSSSEYEKDSDDKPLESIEVANPRKMRSPSTASSYEQPALTTKRPTVRKRVAPSLPSELSADRPKVMVGGQLWPMQDSAGYCHQCRNKTMVLKIVCPVCPKHYCVRCLTVRYPDEPRALQMKRDNCPACLGFCNCTQCCKRRGVDYISTKNALDGGKSSRAQLSTRIKSNGTSSVVSSRWSSTPISTPAISLPPPARKSRLSISVSNLSLNEDTYWGTIYAVDGSKIGVGYNCPDSVALDTDAVSDIPSDTDVASQSRKTKRVYVGKIHPSWPFDNAVKKSVLEPVPPAKKVHESRRPRKYVGNKAFLFYTTEKMAQELADLSPLSSLEEDWEDEDEKEVTTQEIVDEHQINGTGPKTNQQGSTDGNVSIQSLNESDVTRAIELSLQACGIRLADEV